MRALLSHWIGAGLVAALAGCDGSGGGGGAPTSSSLSAVAQGDLFVTVDSLTGNTTVVSGPGLAGYRGVFGLALDPNAGILYGADVDTGQLLTIDRTTGVGTAVGAFGSGAVNGLAGLVAALGQRVRLAQTGLVRAYALVMLGGTLVVVAYLLWQP